MLYSGDPVSTAATKSEVVLSRKPSRGSFKSSVQSRCRTAPFLWPLKTMEFGIVCGFSPFESLISIVLPVLFYEYNENSILRSIKLKVVSSLLRMYLSPTKILKSSFSLSIPRLPYMFKPYFLILRCIPER